MTWVPEMLMAGALLGALLFALEVGRWLARRVARAPAKDEGTSESIFGALQGALLGLLALLLGFSFAGAATRFIDRQEFVVRVANAIGTTDLRTDLLSEPHQGALRAALRRYLEQQSLLLRTNPRDPAPILQELERLHEQVWMAARDGVKSEASLALLVLPPVNELIDLHGSRLAAARRHLPVPILILLVLSAMVTMGTVGFSARRRGLAWCLTLLVGATLWMTIDLDMPRRGLMQLDPTPITSLQIRTPG